MKNFACSVTILVAVFILLSAATSQDETASLVEELQRLSVELRQQREKQDAERALTGNRKEILLEEIAALKIREKEFEERRRAFEDESGQLEKNYLEVKANVDKKNKMKGELESFTDQLAKTLENHINSGIPVDSAERIETAQRLSAQTESLLEKLKLLWQLYLQEYRRGAEIEITSPLVYENAMEVKEAENKPALGHTIVLGSGERIQGSILRLGSVTALFLSDDANTGAFLTKKAGKYSWRLVDNRKMLNNIRLAFEIVSGRQAPELVILPVQLSKKPDANRGDDGKGGAK